MGVQGILVRWLDAVRHRIETVASAGVSVDLTAGDGQLDESQWSALLRWCASGAHVVDRAPRLVQRLPGLLPHTLRDKVWVGCIDGAGQPRGLLILDLSACAADADLGASFSALLEPFAAAISRPSSPAAPAESMALSAPPAGWASIPIPCADACASWASIRGAFVPHPTLEGWALRSPLGQIA